MKIDSQEIYKKVKKQPSNQIYHEETHCPLVLEIMSNHTKGTVSAFCVAAGIGERTFWDWVNKYPVFAECYDIGRMYAREDWEEEGRNVRHELKMGETCNYSFDYWRMLGWSRFGLSKNSRIRLKLNKDSTPLEHYKELIDQASQGDFTSSEVKQLMEAINVGVNVHDKIQMQSQIDEIKADVLKLNENSNVNG